MDGYTGRMLKVDLTRKKLATEPLDEGLVRSFLGGRGLASKILYDTIDPKVNPFSPRNAIIFATGPLTGSGFPCGCRYMIVSKSPLTGTISSSNAGGFFPSELKFAGFDLIIVTGKAKSPVYLWLADGKAQIRSARRLWGKTIPETQEQIRKETDPKARVAIIGPGGENRVLFASVMNELHDAAGRGGMGAIMGSKNLKAIACRGTARFKIGDSEALKKARRDIMNAYPHSPSAVGLRECGTTRGVPNAQIHGVFPTRNYQDGVFEGWEKLAWPAFKEQIFIKRDSCYACSIACKRVAQVKSGEFKSAGVGPEYESLYSFGPMCGVDNVEAVAKASYLCNELGLDTISTGVTIACAMEMAERGYLSQRKAGGPLGFGNAKMMVELVEKIGRRQGIGNLLAEGSRRFAAKLGHPEVSMDVKGLELPGWGARACKGMGINYATGNRGGCHMKGPTFGVEFSPGWDPFTWRRKAALAIEIQNKHTWIDASGMCAFGTYFVDAELVAAGIRAVTGVPYTLDNLMLIGERIWNLERLFNLKAGFSKKDDTLPRRLLKEPLPGGPGKGQTVELDKMLPQYYRLRGWAKDGRPSKKKLRELELVA